MKLKEAVLRWRCNTAWFEERRMRYCAHCEVGMGLFAWKEYRDHFIWRDGLCPICKKKAAAEPRWMWLEKEQERLKAETRLVR